MILRRMDIKLNGGTSQNKFHKSYGGAKANKALQPCHLIRLTYILATYFCAKKGQVPAN